MATWTPAALSSEAKAFRGRCWRLVEGQHKVATLKIVDSLAEQAVLEDLLDGTKPAVPPECRALHYLLATPFRYGAPYPHGSRFRRAGLSLGVYYASEAPETAVAERAFHRLLFFAESPRTPWPENAAEFTAFSVAFASEGGLDLTIPPLSSDRQLWTDPTDYTASQELCDAVRDAALAVIRYESVRDPGGRANLALLTCRAFASSKPERVQSWRMRFSAGGVHAIRDFPDSRLEFPREAFARDPKVANLVWER